MADLLRFPQLRDSFTGVTSVRLVHFTDVPVLEKWCLWQSLRND